MEHLKTLAAYETAPVKATVSHSIKLRAINLLIPNASVEAKKAIYDYIDERIWLNGNCVLWSISKPLNSILKDFGIYIGRKEIIITPKHLKYSDDYNNPPELI